MIQNGPLTAIVFLQSSANLNTNVIFTPWCL